MEHNQQIEKYLNEYRNRLGDEIYIAIQSRINEAVEIAKKAVATRPYSFEYILCSILDKFAAHIDKYGAEKIVSLSISMSLEEILFRVANPKISKEATEMEKLQEALRATQDLNELRALGVYDITTNRQILFSNGELFNLKEAKNE